jgi:hypothetical protein
MPDGRLLLRHTLATLAYRASKAVRGAPASFSTFSVGDGSRTPGQILAHLGDLMDWALTQARGQQKWTDTDSSARSPRSTRISRPTPKCISAR